MKKVYSVPQMAVYHIAPLLLLGESKVKDLSGRETRALFHLIKVKISAA